MQTLISVLFLQHSAKIHIGVGKMTALFVVLVFATATLFAGAMTADADHGSRASNSSIATCSESVHRAGHPANQRIGVVNLATVISLHPYMSCFDFQRLGFSRDTIGNAVAESGLKVVADSVIPEQRLVEIRKEFRRITAEQNAATKTIHRIQDKAAAMAVERQLSSLQRESVKLARERHELEFAKSFPDLTTPGETRQYFDIIEKEVMELVRQTAVDLRYSVVLNNSAASLPGYPTSYESRLVFGSGSPNLYSSLFYAFLKGPEDYPHGQEIARAEVTRWLHLTAHPSNQEFLPVRPWPLVLAGGEDFTGEVVARLYGHHRIAEDITTTVLKVLSEKTSN